MKFFMEFYGFLKSIECSEIVDLFFETDRYGISAVPFLVHTAETTHVVNALLSDFVATVTSASPHRI